MDSLKLESIDSIKKNVGPLNGLQVIEISHIMAGPTCGLMLADMGADVLVTTCPYCILNFKDSVLTMDKEDSLAIMDLSEIVDEVI